MRIRGIVDSSRKEPGAIGEKRNVLCARRKIASGLEHNVLRTSNLALDLLTCPPSSLNGPGRKLAIRPSLLDQSSEPVLAEGGNQLAVGIRVGQVTRRMLVFSWANPTPRKSYPMTPMEARINASLLLTSLAMLFNNWKIEAT